MALKQRENEEFIPSMAYSRGHVQGVEKSEGNCVKVHVGMN